MLTRASPILSSMAGTMIAEAGEKGKRADSAPAAAAGLPCHSHPLLVLWSCKYFAGGPYGQNRARQGQSAQTRLSAHPEGGAEGAAVPLAVAGEDLPDLACPHRPSPHRAHLPVDRGGLRHLHRPFRPPLHRSVSPAPFQL